MIVGVDVHWRQGAMDWGRTASAGAQFVYAKATEGTGHVDRNFKAYAKGASEAGLLVGAYHYWRRQYPAGEQARHLYSTCHGLPLVLVPAIDFEWTGNQDGPVHGQAVHDMLRATADLFGVAPMVYTAAGWWNPNVGAVAWAADYPLWVASWNDAAAPTLPTAWPDWEVWQYGAEYGPAYGARSATIDANRARSLAALMVLGAPVRWDKVVWHLEEAQRRAEAEGLAAESLAMGRYTADAIARRDGTVG